MLLQRRALALPQAQATNVWTLAARMLCPRLTYSAQNGMKKAPAQRVEICWTDPAEDLRLPALSARHVAQKALARRVEICWMDLVEGCPFLEQACQVCFADSRTGGSIGSERAKGSAKVPSSSYGNLLTFFLCRITSLLVPIMAPKSDL